MSTPARAGDRRRAYTEVVQDARKNHRCLRTFKRPQCHGSSCYLAGRQWTRMAVNSLELLSHWRS